MMGRPAHIEPDVSPIRAASPPQRVPSRFPPPPRSSNISAFPETLPSAARFPPETRSMFEVLRPEIESAAQSVASLDSDSTAGSHSTREDTPDQKGPFRATNSWTYTRILIEENFIIEEFSDDSNDSEESDDSENSDDEESVEILSGILEEPDSDDERRRFSKTWRASLDFFSRPDILRELRGLTTEGDDSDLGDAAGQQRRYLRQKKRWSAGIFKRSHTQSVGSDTDDDDIELLDANEVGSSARRLRRRTSKSSHTNRSSLIFDDLPKMVNVKEVDEEDVSDHVDFVDDGFPFWAFTDMIVDSEADI